jgi:hypothetical protein
LQRVLLALIDENGCLDTFELAGRAYHLKPDVALNGAQVTSVRRALAELARQGLIVFWDRKSDRKKS